MSDTQQKVPTEHHVPSHLLDQLAYLRSQLEKETGYQYEIVVNRFTNGLPYGGKPSVTIGGFDNRTKYTVFDMLPQYAELNGVYPTVKDIEKKTLMLIYQRTTVRPVDSPYHDFVWKCPTCGEYEKLTVPSKNGGYILNGLYTDLCQSCHKPNLDARNSIWTRIKVCCSSGTIYRTDGGSSVSVATLIGKVRFE